MYSQLSIPNIVTHLLHVWWCVCAPHVESLEHGGRDDDDRAEQEPEQVHQPQPVVEDLEQPPAGHLPAVTSSQMSKYTNISTSRYSPLVAGMLLRVVIIVGRDDLQHER